MDSTLSKLIQELQTQPPTTYIDNQFNKCPSVILKNLEDSGVEWSSLLDFGCGHGIKALSLALQFPEKQVVGVDITNAFSEASKFARQYLSIDKLPSNLTFHKISPGQSLKTICNPDAIYSWSVLEHVHRTILPEIVNDMFDSLSANGIMLTQIAPLYYSPFGSHLGEFKHEPWDHLLLSHRELYRKIVHDIESSVRNEYVDRKKWMFSRFEELNKITASELNGYLHDAGFTLTKDKRKKVRLTPPQELLTAFTEEALLTFEIIWIAKKNSGATLSQSRAGSLINSFFRRN